MVKNTVGGNKHKGQARKFATAKPTHKLRLVEEEGELYGQVCQMLGNGMCYVTTLTARKYLCIIRGKFRGRGKRDNLLKNGTWVLVGAREWEQVKDGAAPKCDLLEVYSDLDKEKLKNSVHENWRVFIENEAEKTFTDASLEENILFTNESQEEYQQYAAIATAASSATGKTSALISSCSAEEEIDIDDI
jgi:translation initiation factor IF-1